MKFDYQFVQYKSNQIRVVIYETKLKEDPGLKTVVQIQPDDWERIPEWLQGLTIYHFYKWIDGYGFEIDPLATEDLSTNLSQESPRFCVIKKVSNPDNF